MAYSLLHSKAKEKDRHPFNGEILRMGSSVLLLRGDFAYVDDSLIPKQSLDIVFPSSDLSSDNKQLRQIGQFASRSLRKGGFLVLYSKHTSVTRVSNIIPRTAKGLKLVQVLSAPFDANWLNVDGNPVTSHTGVFLIFWKRINKIDFDYIFEEFPINSDFEDEEQDESHKEIITGEKAALYAIDYILETLRCSPGMTVCDPTCGNANLWLRIVESGLRLVGIEKDLERFQMGKTGLQGTLFDQERPNINQ